MTSQFSDNEAPAAEGDASPPAGEPRPSVADLLLPPVGSVDPGAWKRPVTRSSVPTYKAPQIDPALLPAAPAAGTGPERVAAQPEPVPVEPEPELEPAARRSRFKKSALRFPHTRKPDAAEPAAAPPPVPAPEPEAEASGEWGSSPALGNLTREFFAPPEELRPVPEDERHIETGPDLQLRIYMREILEPWWTGEVGSTTALERLIALRDSLADDPN
jgi:nicotinate-nucleotide--dimethylbenzimidazole phosphoribosyltransferase